MDSATFPTVNVVIKEELVIKEEDPLAYEDDEEGGEVITSDPLFTVADIKPEPDDDFEAMQCVDTFWNGDQPDEYGDDSNSQGSYFLTEPAVSTSTEEQPKYRCKFCSKTYKRFGSFTCHMKIHHEKKLAPTGRVQTPSQKENAETLKCPLCSFTAPTYARLLTHHQEEHPSALQQREFLEGNAREVGGNSGEDAFQCGVCFRKCEDMLSYFSHQKLHEQSVCQECGNMTTHNSIFHKLTHLGKALHHCSHCDKHFSQKSTLALHERRHNKEWSHECNICQEKFIWFYELIKHKKTHSSESSEERDLVNEIKASYVPQGHVCRKCSKSFENIIEYSKHVVSHEEESLTLRCHICDQAFQDVIVLLNHIKFHK